MADLLPVPRRVERQFSLEVNVTRFSENEFREKLHHEDHFLKSVIKGRLIAIMGSLNELEKLLAENKVHAHRTSNKESDDLRAVICGISKMQQYKSCPTIGDSRPPITQPRASTMIALWSMLAPSASGTRFIPGRRAESVAVHLFPLLHSIG